MLLRPFGRLQVSGQAGGGACVAFRSEAEAALHGALRPLIGTEIDGLEVTVESNATLRSVFRISFRLSRTGAMYTYMIEGARGFD